MGRAKRLPESEAATGAEELLCTRCGEKKPVGEFYPHATSARGCQYWCKTCCREVRAARAKLPVDPRSVRKWKLKGAYGITIAEYDALYEKQHGQCAICGTQKDPWVPGGVKGRDRFLMVDHDHADGRIRGLLCGACNHGLGKFRDNPAILLAAISYLSTAAGASPRQVLTRPS